MHEEEKKYYNAASATYSEIRYEGPLLSYTQYVFRKRLQLFLKILGTVVSDDKKVSFIEIGCADGIVMDRVAQTFPNSVQKMRGIDISDKMLEKARAKYPDPRFSFALRGEEGSERYDFVIELGVHVKNLEEEIAYVKKFLNDDGYYLYSAAGAESLYKKIKLRNAEYARDYIPYDKVEETLEKHFEIVTAKPYGLFFPKLWAIPAIARVIQPLIEGVVGVFAPSLFHEKIYLLKNK